MTLFDHSPQVSLSISTPVHGFVLIFFSNFVVSTHLSLAMASRFGAFNEQVPNMSANSGGDVDTMNIEEDYLDLDVVTCADLDSLALSMAIRMIAENDTLLEQIRSLLGGLSSFLSMGLAEIVLVFLPNVTPEPFSGALKQRTKEVIDTLLQRWFVHFQFCPYIDEKKKQLAVGCRSCKALLWWREPKPQLTTWTTFKEAFWNSEGITHERS